MNAVCTEKNAIAGLYCNRIRMNGRGDGTTKRLRNAATQAEVAVLYIRELIDLGGLVNLARVVFIHNLVFYQFGEQAIVVGESLQCCCLAQEVHAAIAHVSINHCIFVMFIAAKNGDRYGCRQVVGLGALGPVCVYLLILLLHQRFQGVT